MVTLDPILQPSPTTELEIAVLFPIVVPFPITVEGPTCAERDCPISDREIFI